MENEKITIRLMIAQRAVELTIQKEWMPYYKEAEKRINDSFINFAKKWTYTDHQDIISKVLIDFVVRSIDTEERLQEYEENLLPKMQKLKDLTDKIVID